MKFHEAAEIFPLEESSLDDLAADIKRHGLMCPIEICDEKILDGRRRFIACEKASVQPTFVDVFTNDPVAYVLSLNLHRRHLTKSQLSMVAARARAYYDKAAKERQRESGGDRKSPKAKSVVENLPQPIDHTKARDAAGKAVGVSGKTVDFASKVLANGEPELINAVDEARMAVSTAAVYASESPEFQRDAASKQKQKRSPKKSGHVYIEPDEPIEGESQGKGIRYAHEAIACLKKISKKDGLRKRGFQIVVDWIRHNQ